MDAIKINKEILKFIIIILHIIFKYHHSGGKRVKRALKKWGKQGMK